MLVAGDEQGAVINGMAWDVRHLDNKAKLEIKERLDAYETKRYRRAGCMIEVEGKGDEEDGVLGITYRCAGDVRELREGSFDLRDWQMARLEEEMIMARAGGM